MIKISTPLYKFKKYVFIKRSVLIFGRAQPFFLRLCTQVFWTGMISFSGWQSVDNNFFKMFRSCLILYCRGFRGWLFLLVSILQLIGYPSLQQVLESRTIGKRGNSGNPCSSEIFPTLENQEEVDPIEYVPGGHVGGVKQ